MPSRGFLGIDWGTHSSKWCYQDASGQVVVGGMWDSHVWRLEDQLAMFTMDRRFEGPQGEEALKRKLIQDPDQPFWGGERPKLRATLGEGVVFSLLVLLLDARRVLSAKGIQLSDRLTVRFSHPNWIESASINALRCYRDAAVVALGGLRGSLQAIFEDDGCKASIEGLREFVNSQQGIVSSLPSFPKEYDHSSYVGCLTGTRDDCAWEFVFESCAAGFPYLLEEEPEEYERPESASQLSVRKLLVVDIGAGSTDAGYMLRTVQVRSGRPLLVWLPPSAALDRAGRWLTERILADWAQSGRRATFAEAELYKTGGGSEWQAKPFVGEWCQAISAHVGHYAAGIPDSDRLPVSPPLELVATGGSTAVEPVKASLRVAVAGALKSRGFSPGLCEKTRLVDVTTSVLAGRGYRPVQVAQLAVALGASSPRLTELKYYPDGLLSGEEMVERLIGGRVQS